jgi:AGCS family alanine or glycine:cation symporter
MAFGAAKSSQPVHEGLVAMLGPVLDTLFICTLSALAILSTGVWRSSTENGISLTVEAFESVYPGVGRYLLLCCIACFSLSALFSSAYYGEKCFSYLFSARWRRLYALLYTLSIVIASVVSVGAVIGFIDLLVVFMVIPTMVSSLLLSPVLVAETRRYFRALSYERA